MNKTKSHNIQTSKFATSFLILKQAKNIFNSKNIQWRKDPKHNHTEITKQLYLQYLQTILGTIKIHYLAKKTTPQIETES